MTSLMFLLGIFKNSFLTTENTLKTSALSCRDNSKIAMGKIATRFHPSQVTRFFSMGENSGEFLPIAILGNRYAVLIKIEFLEIPFCL
jgi:hypothetical protein